MAVITEKEKDGELTKTIKEFCQETDSEESWILLADGFEEAFVGIGNQHTKEPVAIYDREKCIEILVRRFSKSGRKDEDDLYTEAVEYLDFNVTGSWVGDRTPIFMSSIESYKTFSGLAF